MIRAENLCFAFTERDIFRDLSLTVERGEFLTILGPNGCGKSTLLRLLRGSLPARSGRITWNGTALDKISAREMARRVAVVPQTTHVGFPYRVSELVAMGRYPHRKGLFELSGSADRKAIRHALALTDTLPLADRPVTRLSGGELQRVLLARALAQETEVLFLDEATSHLDIDHRLELSELLVRLNREQGVTLVQVSHDLDLAAAVSRRILLLTEHGNIAGLGTPREVMTADNLRRVFRVELKVADNPYTGTPQIIPLINRPTIRLDGLGIHLICGGGSGRVLLRRLHLANARLSAGPLNHGDSDEEIAGAIEIPVVREVAFHPFSAAVLEKAEG